jgi:hypothetical protein
MKKILYLVAAVCVCTLVMGQFTTPTTYSVLRTISATEDTQLTATTQLTPEVGNSSNAVRISRHPIGAIHIRFKGTDAANETFSWTLWAHKDRTAPAQCVAYGTGILGATQTGTSNEFYADTLVITAQQWHKTLAVTAGAPDAIVNGGGISELVVDTCEYQIWKVIIRDIAGGGAEAATLGVDYCTFY